MSAVQRHRLPCGPRCPWSAERRRTPLPTCCWSVLACTDRAYVCWETLWQRREASAMTTWWRPSPPATRPTRAALQRLPHRPGGDGGEQQQQHPARDRVTVAGQQRGGRRLGGPAGVTWLRVMAWAGASLQRTTDFRDIFLTRQRRKMQGEKLTRTKIAWTKNGADENLRGRKMAQTKICVDEKWYRRKSAWTKSGTDENLRGRKMVQTKICVDEKWHRRKSAWTKIWHRRKSAWTKNGTDEILRGRKSAWTKNCVDENMHRRKNIRTKKCTDEKIYERKNAQTKECTDEK